MEQVRYIAAEGPIGAGKTSLARRLAARMGAGLLEESYTRFFYHYSAAPVLIVNSQSLNFVDRDADFELLVERVRGMRSRREFFNVA